MTKRKSKALATEKGKEPPKRKEYTDEERAALEAKLPKPARSLNIPYAEGMDYLRACANEVHDPTAKAAFVAIAALDRSMGATDLGATVSLLRDQVAEVQAGDMGQSDRMLVAQAYTLDAVFTECLRMWLVNQANHHSAAMDYLRSAMKAQSAARSVWESISKIHNPIGSATFVKQANIANGPQQVNNGVSDTTTPASAPAHEQIANQPNELKGGAYRGMDSRAETAAVGGDTQVGTLAQSDRTENGGG